MLKEMLQESQIECLEYKLEIFPRIFFETRGIESNRPVLSSAGVLMSKVEMTYEMVMDSKLIVKRQFRAFIRVLLFYVFELQCIDVHTHTSIYTSPLNFNRIYNFVDESSKSLARSEGIYDEFTGKAGLMVLWWRCWMLTSLHKLNFNCSSFTGI